MSVWIGKACRGWVVTVLIKCDDVDLRLALSGTYSVAR